MSATDSYAPELAARAREITEVEKASYEARTPRSQAATERARRSLPLGVPSSFQAYDPHPIVASGPRRRGWRTSTATTTSTSTWASARCSPGTATRSVRAAIEQQLDDGTLFVTPVRGQRRRRRAAGRALRPADVAVHQLRHRGDDGRHPRRPWRHRPGEDRQGRGRLPRPPRRGDDLDEAAARRGRAGRRARRRCRRPPASPRRCSADTIVIPYNDPEALERVLRRRRRRLLHRRAGDGEHRHLPARRPATCEAVREITAAPRHAADLRRGQDRHHRRLGRRHRRARRAARPRHAGQVASAAACRSARSAAARSTWTRSPRARCCTSARTTATRSCMAADQGGAGRGVHARGDARGHRPQPPLPRRAATPSSPSAACPPTPSSSAPRAASPGRPSPSATTATTRRPTSTWPSPSGCGASTAASCSRRASTSSGSSRCCTTTTTSMHGVDVFAQLRRRARRLTAGRCGRSRCGRSPDGR